MFRKGGVNLNESLVNFIAAQTGIRYVKRKLAARLVYLCLFRRASKPPSESRISYVMAPSLRGGHTT